LLRLYRWARPAVSIGYFQKFPDDLAAQYDIVRRPTGGGLVYHGDDTTFTLVVPPAHRLYRLRAADAYGAIHTAVAGTLEGPTRLAGRTAPVAGPRYECFQHPVTGDVLVGHRKLAGGAQRRTRDGLLHQGSIAAAVAERLPDAFGRAFGCRWVTYRLSDEQQARIVALADGKYRTAAWNHRR
jgi:lipoate-protein ligase A